jgi:hypothetical protein
MIEYNGKSYATLADALEAYNKDRNLRKTAEAVWEALSPAPKEPTTNRDPLIGVSIGKNAMEQLKSEAKAYARKYWGASDERVFA